jgi:hypothetical protein
MVRIMSHSLAYETSFLKIRTSNEEFAGNRQSMMPGCFIAIQTFGKSPASKNAHRHSLRAETSSQSARRSQRKTGGARGQPAILPPFHGRPPANIVAPISPESDCGRRYSSESWKRFLARLAPQCCSAKRCAHEKEAESHSLGGPFLPLCYACHSWLGFFLTI